MRAAALIILITILAAAEPTVVGVWDPGHGAAHARFAIDAAWLDRVAGWVADAGLPVVRPDTAALAAGLDPARIPVLVLPGGTVPRPAIAPLLAYAEAGGILVGLAARVPFLVAIEAGADGAWDVSPREPRFAWQVDALQAAFGLRYVFQPALHDQGVIHVPGDLFRRYVPDAGPVRRRLPHVWLCSRDPADAAAGIWPLVDSRRGDGGAVIPAVYVARRGRCTAVLATQDAWCGAEPAAWWPRPAATVQGLVRLARDLAAGAVTLDPAAAIRLPADPPPPEPLATRPAAAGVDPDGATAVARFGAFDGSGCDLGPPLAAGATLALAPGRPLPRRLDPGAAVSAPLPPLGGGQLFLRLRCAFAADGAAAEVAIGGSPLLAEEFVYEDPSGASNNAVEAARPVELERIVPLPPGAAGDLRLANPGRRPLWLDALQIERQDRGTPPVVVGCNLGFDMGYPGRDGRLPPGIARDWGLVRAGPRLQFLGPPGDPARWATCDLLVGRAAALGAPLHLVLEGCPEWLAEPASFRAAVARKRPHICVPRLAAWQAMLEELVPRYRERVAAWELCNEVDIAQFWIGTPAEYAALWRTTRAVLQRLDPGKPLFNGGLAHAGEDIVDALAEAGALGEPTWFANHGYAGQSPMWELNMGRLQGMLYNRGVATPLFANEQGFVWRDAEWFAGGGWTPQRQAAALSAGLARVMAAGTVRVSVFNAGGDANPYGLIDAAGVPRPAYAVLRDYLVLGAGGARRLDAGVLSADGAPLRGIYVVASQRADGGVTAVLDPAESAGERRVRVRLPLPDPRPRCAVRASAGREEPLALRQDGAWVEAELDLDVRCVVRFDP